MSEPAPRKLYFVNGFVDYALIGGASVVSYLILLRFRGQIHLETVYAVSAWLVFVVNHPHFSASSYRLYHTPRNIKQYPVTSLVVPLVILAGAVASFAHPREVAPYFIKLYIIWSPYHFCGQTLGVSLLYAKRAGIKFSQWERFALSSFIYSTFLAPTLRFETGAMGADYYGILYPTFGLPAWTASLAQGVMWLSGLAVLLIVLRWKIRDGKLPPLIVLLPALTQFVWFVPGAKLRAFNEFVPAFHSLQYLLIAWAVQLSERKEMRSIEPSSRYVFWETVRWGLINVIGGLILFETLPLLLASTGHSLFFVTGIVFAAVQIHHFFVDGVVWKLRSPTVASPLMGSWADLVGKPAEPSLVENQEVRGVA